MTGVIRIAGVELPILIDSLSVSNEAVGYTGRNINGWRQLERRAEKQVISGVIAPKTLDEIALYRALVRGDGEFWSMRYGVYGSKGWAITGTGAYDSTGGGNPHFTNGTWWMDSSETMVVQGNLYNQGSVATQFGGRTGSTLIAWRWDNGASTYSIVGFSWRARDVTATVKREVLAPGGPGTGGAPQSFTGAETFSVATGSGPNSPSTLTVTNAGFDEILYSHILLLPWYFPAAQVDMLLSGRNLLNYAMPDLPDIYVTSDLFPSTQVEASPTVETASLVMQGTMDSHQIQVAMVNGSLDKTHGGISFTLTEV